MTHHHARLLTADVRDAPSTKWGQRNIQLVSAMSAVAVAVATLNVAVDPFGVFGTKNGMPQFSLNERYVKVEHLLNKDVQADSFIIGSSTSDLYKTDAPERLRPGSHWYNLAFMAGTPNESLHALQLLKANGRTIKEVIFGIDLQAYAELNTPVDAWEYEHPSITHTSYFQWWKGYLFASSLKQSMQRVAQSRQLTLNIAYDIEGSGAYTVPSMDAQLKADPEKYIATHHKTDARQLGNAVPIAFVESRFKELQSLVDWLNANGVRFETWINPIAKEAMVDIPATKVDEFESRVRSIVGTQVPDFLRCPEITGDLTLFYDRKHYVPALASRITYDVLGSSVGRRAQGECPDGG